MATKTGKFGRLLEEREKEALKMREDNQSTYETERAKTEALERAAQLAEEAVSDLEGKARRGDPSVTGRALVEVRGDHEIAQMALSGNEARVKRLADWLDKCNYRKDVAEVVRDALLIHLLPGAEAYATFHTGGFAKDTAKPENLPVLVVTQLEGRIGTDGIGEGRVRLTWNRSNLHAPLSADRLRGALTAAGFAIDSRYSLNDGLTVISGDGADTAEVSLRNVAQRTPVALEPLSSVDGWDEGLALQIARSHELVEAQGVGARLESVTEDGGIRTTTVRLSVAAWTDERKRESQDINLSRIFANGIAARVDEARRHAGRCVSAKEVPVIAGKGAAFAEGKRVFAAEFTYCSRVA